MQINISLEIVCPWAPGHIIKEVKNRQYNADGNSGASGYDSNRASFAYDGWQNMSGNGYVDISYTGKTKQSQVVSHTFTISGVITEYGVTFLIAAIVFSI